MSYEFELYGTRTGPSREGRNPFTGKPATIPTFVMNEAEHAAVLEVITRHGGTMRDGGGAIVLACAELTFGDLAGPSFRASVTGAIEPAIEVLFEVATAGRLVITNERSDEPVPVVTTAEAAAQAEASGVEPAPEQIVTDVSRFLRVLLPGYDRTAAELKSLRQH